LLFGAFLLTARSVELRLEPAEASLAIDGGVSLRIAERVLLRPGAYVARAESEGYRSLEQAFTVTEDTEPLTLALEKLPGLLELDTRGVDARVLVDGEERGRSNGAPLEIPAGTRRLRLEAERYRPLEQDITVDGMGRKQRLALELVPAWGTYRIETLPAGATVQLEHQTLGTTPIEVELLEGTRQLQLRLAGHRDESLTVAARAGETRTIDALPLQRADAVLRLASTPSGASVTLDGKFLGTTPLELALESGKSQELIAFKAGHEKAQRRITPTPGTQELQLALRPLTGVITLALTPADAEVLANGRVLGKGSGSYTLPAIAQTITVRAPGHLDRMLQMTPRPGFPQQAAVRLETREQAREAREPTRRSTSIGQELVLLRPGALKMGSSRREAGRRANESMRDIVLSRPFYLGVAEVSNAEFRRFRSAHSSGNFKGKSLNGDKQPAANISWNDAALFCNWLSEQEGLKPFYLLSGKTVSGYDPRSTGYRLPTEAEWAWASGVASDGTMRRFPWGDALPPPPKSGNYGDRSGESILGEIIAGYDDGFASSAPVKSFEAGDHGLFDIGGNAAEWTHDVYEAAVPPGAPARDPLGPDIGEYHVIRGASWRHGGLTELRLAFRDYGSEGRADVGFRIARYAR
jgi:formylglycine-generating enzyme required for sulfatase activity